MELTLRAGTPDDIAACAKICYEAFSGISEQHGFPGDFHSVEETTGLIGYVMTQSGAYSIIAESEGRVIGSNFLWEDDTIAGIGPITVATDVQAGSVGRRMMEAALERVREKNKPGVRLVQAAFNNRSLSLYAKLGFVVREPLANMQGDPPRVEIPGHTVRPATEADLDACNALCRRVHGHDRSGDLAGAVAQGASLVVEHADRITGYSSQLGFMGHAVGESNDDIKALIAGAQGYAGPGLLVPTRNADLFLWCLQNGMRVNQPMNLMSLGLYNEPQGAFLPSVLF